MAAQTAMFITNAAHMRIITPRSITMWEPNPEAVETVQIFMENFRIDALRIDSDDVCSSFLPSSRSPIELVQACKPGSYTCNYWRQIVSTALQNTAQPASMIRMINDSMGNPATPVQP